MVCTAPQVLSKWSDQEEWDEQGVCGSYGEEEKYIPGLAGETWGKETIWKTWT